jgi:deazaflavin-dependent oxidoreductase (nitroreductase family)
MPLPRALGRFNRLITNRILGPIVVHIPWFGRLGHVGRRSGRRYRTPLMAFERGDRWVIAMMYGIDTDWARNVLAAGHASLETGSRSVVLDAPRLVHDPSRRLVPAIVRPMLALLGVSDFMVLRAAGAPGAVAS